MQHYESEIHLRIQTFLEVLDPNLKHYAVDKDPESPRAPCPNL